MRVDYWSLPPELNAALTTRFAVEVTSVTSRPGGFSGGVAASLGLTDGRTVFVKGCPAGHPIRGQYEIEGWFGRRVREWTRAEADRADDKGAAPEPPSRLTRGQGTTDVAVGGPSVRDSYAVSVPPSAGSVPPSTGRTGAFGFPAPVFFAELEAAGWLLLVFEDI